MSEQRPQDRPKNINAVKGFADVLPSESWKWHFIERVAREISDRYDYCEIRTPTLEYADLFHRGVGETTDIVTKETFTFEDRGGDKVTLRPEGTAGVVRALIEAGSLNDQGARVKVYYIGSNFRYERPQKGRLREHHQFGVEALGVAEPEQDVECILLQLDFYRQCGVRDLSLRVNSLGDRESKQRYRDALVAYLSPKTSSLSEESQRRLTTNPLRILDSKDPRDAEAIQGAPPVSGLLSEKSAKHFDRVRELLERSGEPFSIDGTLVRGFDYYSDTLWEVTAGGLGAQNALGGGGRYDNLVEQLGGRPTPGVGFGSGLERLLLALEAQNVEIPKGLRPLVWLASHGDAGRNANVTLLRELRTADIRADMDFSGRSIKAQFKMADRESAAACVVVGDDELANNTVVIKNLKTGEQSTVARADALERLRRTL